MSTTPETNPEHSADGYRGMPTWVKWVLIAVVVVIGLLVIARFAVGGDHGPFRHMSAPTPASVVAIHHER